MRHSKRTVNEAMMAFDMLDRLGISTIVPVGFQPVKYGERTFGQLEALENKLTSDVIDDVLADRVKPVFAQALVAPKPAPLDLSSFFQATKGEETANSVIFHVRIKRAKRTPQQLLDLTGRRQSTNSDVVKTMLLIDREGQDWEEFDFEMFKVGKRISDAQVEKERAKRNRTRDLEVQVLINAGFPEFGDDHPNGDSWQDADGNWCFASFYRYDVVRYVHVFRNALVWHVSYWFGGRE